MAQAQIERFWGHRCLIPPLRAVGRSRQVTAREELGPHRENYFEIHLISDGSVSWWVEDDVYHLPPDSVFMTRPQELHGGVKNMIQPSTLTWLQVDADQLDSAIVAELYTIEQRQWLGANELTAYVTAMLDECRDPKADSARVVDAYFRLFLAKLLRQYHQQGEQQDYPVQLQNLLSFIDANLTEPITMTQLCRQVNLSRSRVFQMFDTYVGQSPISYVMFQKIQRAQQQLRQSEAPITTISLGLGFSSSQHFATAFRRVTGVSPSQYRRT